MVAEEDEADKGGADRWVDFVRAGMGPARAGLQGLVAAPVKARDQLVEPASGQAVSLGDGVFRMGL